MAREVRVKKEGNLGGRVFKVGDVLVEGTDYTTNEVEWLIRKNYADLEEKKSSGGFPSAKARAKGGGLSPAAKDEDE